ncbi:ParA family protein, partial [Bacteroides fragilis]
YGKVIAEMGLPILTTQIPDTKRFRKELDAENRVVFRSTLFAPDKRMVAGSGLPELTHEIISILKLSGYEETASR